MAGFVGICRDLSHFVKALVHPLTFAPSHKSAKPPAIWSVERLSGVDEQRVKMPRYWAKWRDLSNLKKKELT